MKKQNCKNNEETVKKSMWKTVWSSRSGKSIVQIRRLKEQSYDFAVEIGPFTIIFLNSPTDTVLLNMDGSLTNMSIMMYRIHNKALNVKTQKWKACLLHTTYCEWTT